jgi:ribosomal protein S18 acetylase RimI-like enzyme
MIVLAIGFYAFKIYKQKNWDFFKIANVVLILIASFLVQEFFDTVEEIFLTITILLPFLTIVDFIVKIVNKRYSHKMVVFYIRTYSIWLIFALMSEERFFQGNAGYNILAIMVAITYISLAINLFKGVLKFKEEEDSIISKIGFRQLKETDLEVIKEEYGSVQKDHMLLNENTYSLIATQNDKIIGMISTYLQELPGELEDTEAYMTLIEVHEDYRNNGLASELVRQTENHFRGKVYQLRGWSSVDKVEAIKLWKKLKFTLSPTIIHIEDKNVNVKGLYFTKRL